MIALAAIAAGSSLFMLLVYAVRAQALRPSEARMRVLSPRSQVSVATSSEGTAILRRAASNTLVTRILNASAYARRWQFELERADLKLRPSEYFLIRLALGVVTVAVITVAARSSVAFVISLPVGAISYMLPAYWVRFRTQRRISAIEGQLVETITLIANALRAGFAFAQGIDVAAKRMGPPMSVELGRLLVDINLGMTTEDALHAMNERIGSDDVDMVVTAILIQRQSGGNLAEVLESVTETMRDRERIRGEIKTLTSSQRFTGWVLTIWPALVGLAFFAINPDMTSLMWETGAGRVLLALWVALNIMGGVTIRRILDIDI